MTFSFSDGTGQPLPLLGFPHEKFVPASMHDWRAHYVCKPDADHLAMYCAWGPGYIVRIWQTYSDNAADVGIGRAAGVEVLSKDCDCPLQVQAVIQHFIDTHLKITAETA